MPRLVNGPATAHHTYWPAVEQALAGDILARPGDPRFDPAPLHLAVDQSPGCVRVAADSDLRLGTRRALVS